MSIASKFLDFKAQALKVWVLSLPYFQSEDKWKARAMLALIVALNLGTVYMSVLVNDWNRVFYDALQAKDEVVFWKEVWHFTYLAFTFVVLAVYKFYVTQLLEVRWRSWMTTDTMRRWMAHKAFYTIELMRFNPKGGKDSAATSDNPDQRIQEDINLFTSYTVSLSMGLLNSVVTLFSFIGVLWGLSGMTSISLGGTTYEIAGFMVWAALIYSVAGSVIAHYVGKPQVKLNFLQQRYEADFRHHLVRVREHSEAIALDKGEKVEGKALDMRFSAVLANYLKLLKAQKRLIWFQSGYGQSAIIFPLLLAAPQYFKGTIQIGQFMQIGSAFGYVQGALSWLVDNYPTLAIWKATTDRLTSFEMSLTTVEGQIFKRNTPIAKWNMAEEATEIIVNEKILQLQNIALALPDGAYLATHVNLQAHSGDTIIVSGPSGSGKSTLFRAIAGIWPFTNIGHAGAANEAGHIVLPEGFEQSAMFIPQRPYFPNATLRIALAYPDDASNYSDEALRSALAQALLPQLQSRLDDEDAWDQKLSGGEQQRLALARVFLKKPRWVFADEATSALDEAAEKTVYERLLAHVQSVRGALVSIAHRPAVAGFHSKRWNFTPSVAGSEAKFAVQSAPQ
jgi:vitamin B12/bleomycin/antimicrobial peptide transport system ATP-binding/permease protein